MEANIAMPEQLALSYIFEYIDEGVSRPEADQAIVADAAGAQGQLRDQLREAAAMSDFPGRVEIESVEIRSGSIVIDIVVGIYGVAKTLDLYGGSREGLSILIRDLGRACRAFLSLFLPGQGEVTSQQVFVTLWNPPEPPVPVQIRDNRRWLLVYLVVSNAVLIAAIIFLAVRG